jgi:hypothetical protein
MRALRVKPLRTRIVVIYKPHPLSRECMDDDNNQNLADAAILIISKKFVVARKI